MHPSVNHTANRQKIAAIQISVSDSGQETTGLVTQLPADAALELCGRGFSDRMLRVRYHGLQYFVFREDVAVLPEPV